MRHFAVVLVLAVAAWTQAVASEPHKRHVPRQAEVDTYRPDPYWTPCDYSSSAYPEGCGE